MSNTNFGKKLVSVLLVLVFVFSLIGCKNKKAQKAQEAAVNEATELVEQIKAQIFWDSTAMQNLTGNLKGFITKTKYSNVTVSWESDQPDVISNEGKVSRPNYTDERAVESTPAVMDGEVVVEEAKKVVWVNVTATIKAVVTWQGKDAEESKEIEVTKTFKFSVQTLPSNLFMGTIAECKAAAAAYIYDEQGVERKLVSNSSVVFNAGMYGVVTGVLQADGAGQFMIHDGTEGIFVYNNSVEVAPGDQVLVYGEIYSYYGNLQVGSNITVTVVEDGTAVAGSYREVYPQTLEDEGSALNGEELVKAGYYNGELLYVSGKLVKGAAPQGSGQYHISDPFTGEQVWIYYKSYTADMAATLDSYDGKFVKVRGVSYDRDSRIVKCEILWDGEIEEIAEPTVSDEQKVAVALAGLSVPAELFADYELGEAVWEVVSGTAIVIEEGVAKVTRGEADDTIVLKATITIGTASNSKEFTVKVPAAALEIKTVAELLEVCPTDGKTVTEEKYYVRGVVTKVTSTTYGNLIIADSTGEITIYGSYGIDGTTRYDALEVKPVVGDVVTLYGALTSYVKGENVTKEMKNGAIQEHFVAKTFAEAEELAGTTKDQYTAEKYLLAGTVKSIENAKYGNITLEDAEGKTFTIYGSYSENGKLRYDALEYMPQVGDFVYLYGILGFYNAPQMKNGWYVNVSNLISISAALELCGTDGTYTEAMYMLKGEVKAIASEKYGNMTLVDSEGNEIATYGLYDSTGATRYDALAVKPVVGDTIIVRGTLGAYVKDETVSKQMKNAQLICFTEAAAPAMTDAEKVAVDKEALTVATTQLASFTLPVEGENGSAISWVSDNAAIVVEGAAATVARPAKGAGDATVKLTATIVSGESQETKEFTVTVPEEGGLTVTSIADAIVLCGTTKDKYTTDKYYIKGEIVSIANTTYGNFTVKDATGELYIYGSYDVTGATRYDKLEVKPQVGDIVTLYGILGYYTSPQMKNGWIAEFEAKVWTDADKVAADKAAIELSDKVEADLELPLTGEKGSTISWASNNAAIVIEGAKGLVTQPKEGEDSVTVKLTATIVCGEAQDTLEISVSVLAEVPEPTGAVTYNFITSFETYGKDWSSTYAAHEISSTDLGTGLKAASFVLSNANRQTTTITNMPVICAKNVNQYVTITVDDELTAVEFDLVQWTTKVFADIHIEYSTDGTTWVSASSVITTPAKLASNVTFPAGVKMVRLSYVASADKNTQIGLSAISLTFKQAVAE